MQIFVNPLSSESIMEAAKAFVGEDLKLLYIYTDVITSLWWQEKPEPRIITQEDLDRCRAIPYNVEGEAKSPTSEGSWWHIECGHHSGNQSYYLGLSLAGEVVTCSVYHEHHFHEGDSDFELARWEQMEKSEEDFIQYLRETYPDPEEFRRREICNDRKSGLDDHHNGQEWVKRKFYEGTQWSPAKLVEDIGPKAILQVAMYYERSLSPHKVEW